MIPKLARYGSRIAAVLVLALGAVIAVNAVTDDVAEDDAAHPSRAAAALQQVRDGQTAITAASRHIEAAQGGLTAVTAGSGHDAVATAQAALAQAGAELEQSPAATFAAAERAEAYAATL